MTLGSDVQHVIELSSRCPGNTDPPVRTALEDDAFPFEHLSEIAELESWRKEVNRPIYHIHKWWAQRLGSVFRAVALGAFAPSGSDLLKLFYQRVSVPDAVVFDPFMGSGTTLGETLKIGARAIGRDINPVASFVVRNALRYHSREHVIGAFTAIERDVAPQLCTHYRTTLRDIEIADVLYYFWVKTVDCPQCKHRVDLFPSYIFARHAYSARNPLAHSVCPRCGHVHQIDTRASSVQCVQCEDAYDPHAGPANGARARCQACGTSFAILKVVQGGNRPPDHRLYAKLVMRSDGAKQYLAADNGDSALYQRASDMLRNRTDPFPIVPLRPGYNTTQALNYGYRYWHQMFNDRQLLCLSILADRIRDISDQPMRELFTCLFSGTLEFNNLFASFKGEGTGAVRHMFSHHILKPERVPLEANLWGTSKSSGAFSTLFKSRILRALDYANNPFELYPIDYKGKRTAQKIFNLSESVGTEPADSFAAFTSRGHRLYLSCGDSAHSDLAAESVDAVITDPPFFDNVHYSELADFFHVWQRHILPDTHDSRDSTRSDAEVQTGDVDTFVDRLHGVFRECHRVLRHTGIMAFTYHHSRPAGWRAILQALLRADFEIIAGHPIKAEMSIAQPKHQAKEPIDLDVILVCRKRQFIEYSPVDFATLLIESKSAARDQIGRFSSVSRELSRNDVRVILNAQVIKRLSIYSYDDAISTLNDRASELEPAIEELHTEQASSGTRSAAFVEQTELW